MLQKFMASAKSLDQDLTPAEIVGLLEKLDQTQTLILEAKSLHARIGANLQAVASVMGLGIEQGNG